MVIRNQDIVIVGQQPWDTEIGSNCKNIALEFSKHNRVLYVNSPLDRITTIRHSEDLPVKKRLDIIQRKQTDLEIITSNLWVYYPDVIIESINWIKIGFIFDFFNKKNNLKIANSIKKAIEKLGFKNFILFNDNDIFRGFYLKEYLQPLLSIYYSRDYLVAMNYWKFHGKRLEPKLMAKSDICVSNSSFLTAICKKHNLNAFDIGQGCEVELFQQAHLLPVPDDIKSIPKPIVGYVGALISLRLDIDIIKCIAVERPHWNIVLVGPEDEDFKSSELHHLKNIHFLGAKNPEELPAYIDSFSVCINPQLVNELTIGNYPRKIDEYLAAGKPVVATKTEAMSVFKGFCALANHPFEYIELIQSAIIDDHQELAKERRNFAAGHTWENSVMKIYESIAVHESNV